MCELKTKSETKTEKSSSSLASVNVAVCGAVMKIQGAVWVRIWITIIKYVRRILPYNLMFHFRARTQHDYVKYFAKLHGKDFTTNLSA